MTESVTSRHWPRALARVFLSLCVGFTTYCLCASYHASPILTLALPTLCALFLMFRYCWLERTLEKATPALYAMAVLFALVCVQGNTPARESKTLYLAQALCGWIGGDAIRQTAILGARLVLQAFICLAVAFLLLGALDFLWSRIKRVVWDLSAGEKRFFLIAATVAFLCVLVVTRLTTLFTIPAEANSSEYLLEDRLYSMDTGYILQKNAYLVVNNLENDIRQPLFAVFSMPFAAAAQLIARLFPADPYAFTTCILLMQILAIQATILLLSRLTDEKPGNRLLFRLLMEVSFPVLLFTLNAEQYVFPVFWVAMLVDAFARQRGERETWYIAATGSLITSGVLLPFLFSWKRGAWRENRQAALRLLGKGLAVISLTGLMARVPALLAKLSFWLDFNAKVTFGDKLLQFINAAGMCLIRNPGEAVSSEYGMMYNMLPITSVNWVGVAVLALAVAGFVLNRKNRFAWACGCWVLLSVFVELVVGWGAGDNTMIVYSYYFSWAYVSLACMALFRLLKRWPAVRVVAFAALTATVLALNVVELSRILSFGMTYYPYPY